MSNLDIARSAIDEIDRQLAALFEKRMEAVEMIADAKKAQGLPVSSPERASRVIARSADNIYNENFKKPCIDFFTDIVKISESYQRGYMGIDDETDISTDTDSEVIQTGSMPVPAFHQKIVIKRGLFNEIGKYIDFDKKVLIVTDSGVPYEYVDSLSASGEKVFTLTLEQGEESKSFDNLLKILGTLQDELFTKDDVVIALGGGMVSDITGFASSVYKRGIKYYIIPTTLLSCIDASIGGKNAINFGGIKNVIGSIYLPELTLTDPDLLSALPKRQIVNGFAEAIKTGIILDERLFSVFENDDPFSKIDEIIERCVALKLSVVEKDMYDAGYRRILNFGHTIGHSIESVFSYSGGMLHGECVALGMLPVVARDIRGRLLKIYRKIGLPDELVCEPSTLFYAIQSDKKADRNGVNMIFSDKIGSFRIENIGFDKISELIYDTYI